MKLYQGYRSDDGEHLVDVVDLDRLGPVIDLEAERHAGGAVTPLVHHRRHSPAGLAWGYLGAGPADLARSLIIDHLGERAWCLRCSGTGLVAPARRLGSALDPDQCWACLAEGTTFGPLVYQTLKHEVVAGWGSSWQLRATELERFLGRLLPAARRRAPGARAPRHVRVLGPRLETEGHRT